MQDALEFKVKLFRPAELAHAQRGASVFVGALVLCIFSSAAAASWIPLPLSIATVFLFAGPHNWFELRYFLMRLPVRFGKSRNFFLTAFTGLLFLTITYVSLPLIYRATTWSNETFLTLLASWNTLLLAWLCSLVWLRGRQKPGTNWSWVVPAILALGALNWLQPDFFSLSLVYIHPLVALWFLDRHLRRNRPGWVKSYRRCLAILPFTLGLMIWQLSGTSALRDDNGLFWRITQHSGAELLPNISSHLLVSVHLFLEMLHYGVWLVALPLLGSRVYGTSRQPQNSHARIWNLKSLPLVRHPRGFPKLIALALGLGVVLVGMLWVGFSIDYSTTRDIYFTVAIAHVMAEAPFLLKMI